MSNFQKIKKQINVGTKENPQYKLESAWTSSDTVDVDGSTLTSKVSTYDTHVSNTSNPHSVTKAQVGLGNVENKSSATIRSEITSSNVTTALGYTPIDSAKIGANSGVASLDANGIIVTSQLPSYVDDVLEGTMNSNLTAFTITGQSKAVTPEAGKVYVDILTNKTYRWGGSVYVAVGSDLALGETSSTAYAGDKGKAVTDALATHKADTTVHITASERTAWNAKGSYSKPSGGIPKTDLASAVQTSLGKADTALQSVPAVSTTAAGLAPQLPNDAEKYLNGKGQWATVSSGTDKMDKENPTGTGSFSLNRMADTDIGDKSVAVGFYTTASGSGSLAEGWKATASGSGSHAEGANTIAYGDYSHAEGELTQAKLRNSHAEGYDTIASGDGSHAEGSSTIASGYYSHAEGFNSKAQKAGAHAEGDRSTASGDYSHAEGTNTTASGDYSHSEGSNTIASGNSSHAEGVAAKAQGFNSHAEGYNTTASGGASHAEGEFTIASGEAQHVQGKYNVEDTAEKYAHIVGGGTANNIRKNIHTLDWKGNAVFAGDVTATKADGTTVSLANLSGGITSEDAGSTPIEAKDPITTRLDAAEEDITEINSNLSRLKDGGKNIVPSNNVINLYANNNVLSRLDVTCSYWAKVERNTTYTASKNGGNRFYVLASNSISIGSACEVIYASNDVVGNYTFNSGSYDYIIIYCKNLNETTDIADIKVQIEEGSTATDYEPYYEGVVELTSNLNNINVSTYGGVTFKKNGKMVQVYGNLTNLSTDTIIELSNIPSDLNPNVPYAVLPLYRVTTPYPPIGSCWIFNGKIVIYKPDSITSCYIMGSYMTN